MDLIGIFLDIYEEKFTRYCLNRCPYVLSNSQMLRCSRTFNTYYHKRVHLRSTIYVLNCNLTKELLCLILVLMMLRLNQKLFVVLFTNRFNYVWTDANNGYYRVVLLTINVIDWRK